MADDLTADVNSFESDQTYDRVVSVEMFEHVRNHRGLFQRIYSGSIQTVNYSPMYSVTDQPPTPSVEGEDDWMSKHFFKRWHHACR